MLIPLLSAALAVCAPASASQAPIPLVAMPADALGPSRRAEIDLKAADWISWKSRSYRMSAVFLENIVRAGYDRGESKALLEKIQKLMNQVEETQYAAADMAKEQIRASSPPSAERLAREGEIDKAFEIRALTVYGNMLPRILDEWYKDRQGRDDGRRLAGPEWALALGFDECGPAANWHLALAGFTPQEYHEIEDRAADSLGYPRSKP
jgi:hypothetical protein